MKKLFLSKRAKVFVDVLLGIGLIAVAICSKSQGQITSSWSDPHCIVSSIWCVLIVVHIAQHWKLICAFTNHKVVVRNKITALTILCIIPMFLSILVFLCKVHFYSLHFHGIIGRLFVLTILVHTMDQLRRSSRKSRKRKG